MWEEEWSRRIEGAGLSIVAVPLLEMARAFGPLIAQALLLTQPLLDGLIDRATLAEAVHRLDDPRKMERLLNALEAGRDEL